MSDLSEKMLFGADGMVRLADHGAGVVSVTLHDPERRNAMGPAMTEAWSEAMSHLGERDRRHDLTCVVLTGAGRAFCSGGDLGWLGADPQASVAELRDRMMPFYRSWLALRELSVPSVAAANGVAVGAGAALLLSCDLRIAATQAAFSMPFTRLGLHPGMATTFLLPSAVGMAAARDLLFTSRRIDAEEMLRMGVVSQVVADDQLMERALDIAHQIAANGPVAVRLTRASLADGGPADIASALRTEGVVQAVTLATHDMVEGLAAAQQRREPRFTGR